MKPTLKNILSSTDWQDDDDALEQLGMLDEADELRTAKKHRDSDMRRIRLQREADERQAEKRRMK